MRGRSTKIVMPPPEAFPPEDLGIIASAYGPEEAGDLRDVVGKPPQTEGGEEGDLGRPA